MSKGHLVTRIFRIAQSAYAYKIPFAPKVFWAINRIIFACDIPFTVSCGDGTQFYHNALGVVIHPKTVIGNNCRIYQNVTLGGNGKTVNGKPVGGAPILEDNISVFCGACVLGPIRIGHDSYIGANAVVTKDVPPNSLVLANSSCVIKKNITII